MPATARLLTKAIILKKTGCTEDARRLLMGILKIEPVNITAWIWYADTFDDRAGKIAALEKCLEAVPGNRVARASLRKLRAETAIVYPPAQPLKLFPQYPPIKVYTPPPVDQRLPAGEQQAGGHLAADKRRIRWTSAPLWLAIVGLLITVLAGGWVFGEQLVALQLRLRETSIAKRVLEQQLAVQQNNYRLLHEDRTRLQDDFDAMRDRFAQLNLDFKTLQDQHAQLNQQHSTLTDNYNKLAGEYDQLETDYALLTIEYNNLATEYVGFKAKAIEPPYIFIHDRMVVIAVYRANGTLIRWETPFENLETSILRGSKNRSEMQPSRFRTIDGETFLSYDVVNFVDPAPSYGLVNELYYSSPGADAFIREMWQIVTQLSHYALEEGEVPRLPLETLLSGGGDCEDLSILLASMIRAAPTTWDVQLVYIDSNNWYDPQRQDHVIVYVHTGERPYYIETTSSEMMEPYPYGVTGWFREIK